MTVFRSTGLRKAVAIRLELRRALLPMLALAALIVDAAAVHAADLKVMPMGLGSGTITSNPPGIACGAACDRTYAATDTVTLTAAPAAGSVFRGWDSDLDGDPATAADCTGSSSTCTLTMGANRSVRPVFDLSPGLAPLPGFSPQEIAAFLADPANARVNSAARFVAVLPLEFRQNWILMSRSESLQTGIAQLPRILLPSANAEAVFTLGIAAHSAYPGAHPNAIEYMQWDAAESNFRFHEIVLDAVPAMGSVPARSRGVSADDAKCTMCHSTQNVLNRGLSPGTTGTPPGTIKPKSKPNWDAYDSWAGMLPFNRDQIYQGTVEAAAFRRLFNPWTWRGNEPVRSVIEQLSLQPPGVLKEHVITRLKGGASDGHVKFFFDAASPVTVEPPPVGDAPEIMTAYNFDGVAGSGPKTAVKRDGAFVRLQHSATPTTDEGRGVQLFDLLGGSDGSLNQRRIADELVSHRIATGNVPIDVRPVALAILNAEECLAIDPAGNAVTSKPGLPALTIDLGFFDARNGMRINELLADTTRRAQSLPLRKADIQRLDLDRASDIYLTEGKPTNGLVLEYGAATAAGADVGVGRLRQEVFRRSSSSNPDSTVMGGIYVDRELYAVNSHRVALLRYFLEPLGVSVDKWSTGVRGRSRTYTFADVFGSYQNVLASELGASLGLKPPFDCAGLIAGINSTLSALPARAAVPTYADVQRIFNKSCIECHGGLRYPPYENYGTQLDLSEDEAPPSGQGRLARSYQNASVRAQSLTGPLYRRIIRPDEKCPYGMMPCSGPALSKADIETIRRWIEGGHAQMVGLSHVRTVDGAAYDFQGAGEFVALRGEGLELQVRQTAVATAAPLAAGEHTGLASCAAVSSAVAMRIGAHRITYQPAPGLAAAAAPELRIDGVLTPMSGREILLPTDGRIIRTGVPGGLHVETPGGTTVAIAPIWSDAWRLWHFAIDVRRARASEGVMGAIAHGSWLPALPDGRTLGSRPADPGQRFRDLYGTFASAWRVSEPASLFDYPPGASPESFRVLTWPEIPGGGCQPPQGSAVLSAPAANPLSIEMATAQCGGFATAEQQANCARDVSVLGETGFAQSYRTLDEMRRVLISDGPELASPADNQAGLAAPVTFSWRTTSRTDGGSVLYKLCVWGVERLFTLKTCDAVQVEAGPAAATPSTRLSGLEPGRSYFWKVIAEDDRGGSAESETRRFTLK